MSQKMSPKQCYVQSDSATSSDDSDESSVDSIVIQENISNSTASAELVSLADYLLVEIQTFKIRIDEKMSDEQLIKVHSSICNCTLKEAQLFLESFIENYSSKVERHVEVIKRKKHSEMVFKTKSKVLNKWSEFYKPKSKRMTRSAEKIPMERETLNVSPPTIRFANNAEIFVIA
jgi:FMN-dependent NADH-azoreductase